MSSARFIAFEGGEGCGKSTQARRLAEHLGAFLTREPGGTEVGVRLRALLLDPATGALDDRAEALLMLADRAQHAATVIRPHLAAGRHVVTDRYAASTLAYQGAGRGLPVDELRSLSAWAAAGLEPDLVVLLDVPPEVAHDRLGPGRDRMEGAGAAFHARVREGFLVQAAADPERWITIEASAGVDTVWAEVVGAVTDRL